MIWFPEPFHRRQLANAVTVAHVGRDARKRMLLCLRRNREPKELCFKLTQ
jgi:hypothetical protein